MEGCAGRACGARPGRQPRHRGHGDEGDVPRGQDGRRQPAGFCVRKICGRPVRAGRLCIREARRGRFRAGMGCHQVHPVQPVRLCVPARHHSSVCAERRGGGRRARGPEGQEDERQGLRGISVCHDRLAAGLHGLWRVRGRVPGPRQGAENGAAGDAACPAGRVRLLRGQCFEEARHDGRDHGEGQPVQPAAA